MVYEKITQGGTKICVSCAIVCTTSIDTINGYTMHRWYILHVYIMLYIIPVAQSSLWHRMFECTAITC